MENRPEFITTWLGFAKLGVTVGADQHASSGARCCATRSRRPRRRPRAVVGRELLPALERPVGAGASPRCRRTSSTTHGRPPAGAGMPADAAGPMTRPCCWPTRSPSAGARPERRPRDPRRPPRRRRPLPHLHLRHDRAPESGAALAHALPRRRRRHVGDRRLRPRRRDRLRAAALPRRRRHGGGLVRARAGRGGRAPAPLQHASLLGGGPPRRRHRVSVRRRALPLSPERPALARPIAIIASA